MLLFFVSSLCGIVLSFLHLSLTSLLVCVLIGVLSSVYYFFTKDEYLKNFTQLCVLVCVGLVVGQVRVLLIHYPDVSPIQELHSKKVALRGTVVREPVSDGEAQKIQVHVENIFVGSTTHTIDTDVLIRTHAFPEFFYGDVLVASGTLRTPEAIIEEDGRHFDYQMYLFKDRITHTLSFATAEKVAEKGSRVLRVLFLIKSRCVDVIRDVLPEPHAGLLSGILLGVNALPERVTNNFRTAGLSHIVVLSGYNITVVAESVLALMKIIAVKFAFGVSLLGVLLFVLMSGAGASAVRAGIMASIALAGKQFNKTYDASRALVLAVWGMIIWNPFIILYDPSFHLSVLATVGVMYVTPIVSRYLSWMTEKYGLKELSATTLGAQLAVLPYILYMSGNFGVFAFPANFMVLPLVPLTMLLGFLTSVFGWVSRFLGLIPGVPTYLLLSWDLFIAESVSKFPFATLHVPYIPVFILVIFYSVFGFFLYRFNARVHIKQNPSKAELYSDDDSVVKY